MYSIHSQENVYGVTNFVADTKEDLKDININGCAEGSTCFIIADSAVYMLNSKKEWKLI